MAHPGSGSSWEWRLLGVAAVGSGVAWEWRSKPRGKGRQGGANRRSTEDVQFWANKISVASCTTDDEGHERLLSKGNSMTIIIDYLLKAGHVFTFVEYFRFR